MRRGDRVELLRKLANRLSGDDYPWEDMELVLGQFGFSTPYAEDWERGARSFVLSSLQTGEDDALVELDEYLFGGASREVLDPLPLSRRRARPQPGPGRPAPRRWRASGRPFDRYPPFSLQA